MQTLSNKVEFKASHNCSDNISVAKESDASGSDRIIDEVEEKILSLRDDLNNRRSQRGKRTAGTIYTEYKSPQRVGAPSRCKHRLY